MRDVRVTRDGDAGGRVDGSRESSGEGQRDEGRGGAIDSGGREISVIVE